VISAVTVQFSEHTCIVSWC